MDQVHTSLALYTPALTSPRKSALEVSSACDVCAEQLPISNEKVTTAECQKPDEVWRSLVVPLRTRGCASLSCSEIGMFSGLEVYRGSQEVVIRDDDALRTDASLR